MAYIAFALALAIMLLIAGFYLPGGLLDSEIRSALISDHLNPALLFQLRPEELIYLPYRLLQAASISVFGFSIIGIKLPSIVLGFGSALGILYLLNLWYRRNVAIVAAMIAVTTNQFLIAAQAGEAGVAYIFLTTMVLVSASMISRRSAYARLWVLAGSVLAAVSLYMPLNLYVLVALLLTSIIHPHARHVVFKQAPKSIVFLSLALFLAIVAPLLAGIVNDPSIVRTLLGFPVSMNDITGNIAALAHNYTAFNNPVTGAVLVPVYGLGIMLLIVLGLYRLFSAKYTARSYILSFWLVLLIPLVCVNPSFVSITFVPVVLLLALAVEYLIRSWYKLFPRNPYARVFGLLPLGVLVVGLVVSSIDRYVYGLHYDTAVYDAYSYDVPILASKLRSLPSSDTVLLVVSPKNAELYRSFAEHQNYVTDVTVSTDPSKLSGSKLVIVERSLKSSVDKIPSDILVTRTSQEADRFYLYKNS